MDDDKKKKKEENVFEAVGGLLAIGFIILAWPNIVAYFNVLISTYIPGASSAGGYWAAFLHGAKVFTDWLVVISIPVSIFFIFGIIYSVERLKVLREKEAEKHDLKVEPAFEDEPAGQGDHDLSVRWKKATDLLASENQNDWKQAILEADTMLDDILTGLGYQGESIGEKLKRVAPGDFKSLDDAWEAHKIRNQIAHDGSAFQLTHHEANQTIARYRRVFEEFYYI